MHCIVWGSKFNNFDFTEFLRGAVGNTIFKDFTYQKSWFIVWNMAFRNLSSISNVVIMYSYNTYLLYATQICMPHLVAVVAQKGGTRFFPWFLIRKDLNKQEKVSWQLKITHNGLFWRKNMALLSKIGNFLLWLQLKSPK